MLEDTGEYPVCVVMCMRVYVCVRESVLRASHAWLSLHIHDVCEVQTCVTHIHTHIYTSHVMYVCERERVCVCVYLCVCVCKRESVCLCAYT